MNLFVQVDTKGLDPFNRRVTGAVQSAASKAGGDAIRGMRVEGSRRIRERKAMKVAAVNKALVLGFPSNKAALVWSVTAKATAVPVFSFPVRQTKQGVSAMINQGSRTLIRHAFIATMKSGHTGVFMRYGAARIMPVQSFRGQKRYAGQRRQPIRELYTTTVADAFRDALPFVVERGRRSFATTFDRLLQVEASRARLRGAA